MQNARLVRSAGRQVTHLVGKKQLGRSKMEILELEGPIGPDDLWFGDPDVGCLFILSRIKVPDILHDRHSYDAKIRIITKEHGEIPFTAEVHVEPAQINAIGQRRERAIAVGTPSFFRQHILEGARITLSVFPVGKKTPAEVDRFRRAIAKKYSTPGAGQ